MSEPPHYRILLEKFFLMSNQLLSLYNRIVCYISYCMGSMITEEDGKTLPLQLAAVDPSLDNFC
jgi:hypothetical protein